MNRSARSVLRKIGTDFSLDEEREARLEREAEEARARMQEDERPRDGEGLSSVPEEMLTESEKRHEQYRRRQAMGGKFSPAAESLPIMTTEERTEREGVHQTEEHITEEITTEEIKPTPHMT